MRDRGIRPVTLMSERQTALTIWKFGIDEGLILAPIRKVIKPKITGRITRAFTRAHLTDAVNGFSLLDLGPFQSGCSKVLWLRAWVAYVYETGARFTDAYNLHSEALIDEGVAWVASKTGRPVVKRLSPETRALINELLALSPDGTVFRWAVSRRWAFATIRSAFKEVGLPVGRTQWLRRSGATHVEMMRPGAAKEYLGHAASSHGLAEKHYLDLTQMMDRAPAPVSLGLQ
jgi:integrase